MDDAEKQSADDGAGVSLIVAPAAAARIWTNRVAAMTALACTLAVMSGIVGVVTTENVDVAGGAITVLAATAFFLLSLVPMPVRSARCRRRARLRPVPVG